MGFLAPEAIVGYLLLFVGWYVVHRFAKARENDKVLLELKREAAKERREAAREVIKQLRDIEDQGVAFHTSPSYDNTKANQLVRACDRVADDLAKWKDAPMPFLVRQMYQAMTLRNIDPDEFVQQSDHSEIALAVRRAIGALTKELLPQTRLWSPPTSIAEVRKNVK